MGGEKDAVYFHLISLILPQKLSCNRGYQRKVFIQITFPLDGVSLDGYNKLLLLNLLTIYTGNEVFLMLL